MTHTTQELYSALEAARLLRVHVRTIKRWVAEGRLNPGRTSPNGRLVFRREDLLRAVGLGEEACATAGARR